MTKAEFKALRESHALTQRALADLLGYHPNHISRLENDASVHITPRIERMVRRALGGKKKKSSAPIDTIQNE